MKNVAMRTVAAPVFLFLGWLLVDVAVTKAPGTALLFGVGALVGISAVVGLFFYAFRE